MSIKRVTLASAICLAFAAPAFAQVEMPGAPEVDTEVSTQAETEMTISSGETEKTVTSETETSESVIIDLPREDVAGSVETFTAETPMEKNESIMAAPEMSLEAPELETETDAKIDADTEVELWSDQEDTVDTENSVEGQLD